jgi:hypothetical protein
MGRKRDVPNRFWNKHTSIFFVGTLHSERVLGIQEKLVDLLPKKRRYLNSASDSELSSVCRKQDKEIVYICVAIKSILHCANVAHGAGVGHCCICSQDDLLKEQLQAASQSFAFPNPTRDSQTTNACQSYTRNNTGLIVVTYSVGCLETNARANSATLKPNFFVPCTYPDANICFSI